VQSEIDKALRSKVWLKSGGYIVINQTRPSSPLTSTPGASSASATTASRTPSSRPNIEAVKEIVRQIRLRDLGASSCSTSSTWRSARTARKSPSPRPGTGPRPLAVEGVQVSDFGLIIITRKRVKQSLERVMTQPCPYCSGTAVIRSAATICYEILDEVAESRCGGGRAGCPAARQPGYRAGVARGGVGGAARDARRRGQARLDQVGPAPAPRAVRRDGPLAGPRGPFPRGRPATLGWGPRSRGETGVQQARGARPGVQPSRSTVTSTARRPNASASWQLHM